MRMNDNRTINKICNTKLDGVRRVGRPKLRWEDDVDQDMKILEVNPLKPRIKSHLLFAGISSSPCSPR